MKIVIDLAICFRSYVGAGLSFSVPQGIALPPSLQNIFKEIAADLNIHMSGSGDLTPWANQVVCYSMPRSRWRKPMLDLRMGDFYRCRDCGFKRPS
jgi:hypothetical protein